MAKQVAGLVIDNKFRTLGAIWVGFLDKLKYLHRLGMSERAKCYINSLPEVRFRMSNIYPSQQAFHMPFGSFVNSTLFERERCAGYRLPVYHPGVEVQAGVQSHLDWLYSVALYA